MPFPVVLAGSALQGFSSLGRGSPPPDTLVSTASSDSVGAFHAHIVLFCFPDFFVELARDQMDRSFLDPLRNFGGWLFLVLKGQFEALFSWYLV